MPTSTSNQTRLRMTPTLRRSPRKIGLLEHCGAGNLGDDATQTAVIQIIRAHWPTSEVCGFTMNPSDSRTRHGIPCYPLRRQTWDLDYWTTDRDRTLKGKLKSAARAHPLAYGAARTLYRLGITLPRNLFHEALFLAKSLNLLRSFDLLIISGGGQLLDSWGGPWSFPYTLFKWVLLARVLQIPCYFINVGAGPIKTRLARFLVKHAVRNSAYISFRDEYSRALVKQIGFTGASEVVADSVYCLDVPAHTPNWPSTQERPVVGIAPMAYCDPRVYYDKDAAQYAALIQKLAQFGAWLVANRYSLTLYSTDYYFDSRAIDELATAVNGELNCPQPDCIRCPSLRTTEELFAQMASMEYIVTCRYHGVVFAHLMNIPVLAIAHHPKVTTLMNDFGLSEYCVDLRSLDSDALVRTFVRMVDNKHAIQMKMAERVAHYREELTCQFASLFSRRFD